MTLKTIIIIITGCVTLELIPGLICVARSFDLASDASFGARARWKMILRNGQSEP